LLTREWAIPRRTNLFQDTIAAVHEHLAGDATVEESAMLRQRTTGEEREVDVVLRTSVGGHEVVVSIEARATARKADLPWVESMLGKHDDLPTSKLVLVSEAGFTGPAKRQAEAKGALAVAPEDLAGDHPARRLIEQLAQLSPREVTLAITQMIMRIRRPNGETRRVGIPLDMNVYSASGKYITILYRLFEAEHEANFAHFASVTNDMSGGEVRARMTPRWNLPGGLLADAIYARWEGVDPAELQIIEEVEVLADVVVNQGPAIEMTTRQLGDVAYSHGEATIGGTPTLIVVTANETGGTMSFRRRPSP
jgi:hypothetical protein